MRKPSFLHERELCKKGYLVIGVDEAGCGCLAGPVVAAAIHLPLDSGIADLNDSKLLKPKKREELFECLVKAGAKFTVGLATHREIDRLNIRQATLLAMKRAIEAFVKALKVAPPRRGINFIESAKQDYILFALIDAWKVPNIKIPQRGIIHGDRLVKSIAAASIVAKVVRDRLMREFDRDYPGYGLLQHKGYGTALHRGFLRKLGPSPIHRRTFLKKMGIAS